MKSYNDLPEQQKGLIKFFDKQELMQLCSLLDIEVDYQNVPTSKQMVVSLVDNFTELGVPEFDESQTLLNEFLLEAGYIDSTGELITTPVNNDGGGNSVIIPVEAIHTLESVLDGKPKPPCFSFADELDPACRRCSVQEFCMVQRIALRPPCFGKLFSPTDDNCKECTERPACRQACGVN